MPPSESTTSDSENLATPTPAPDAATLATTARNFIRTLALHLHNDGLTDFSGALERINTDTVQRGPQPRLEHNATTHLDTLAATVQHPPVRKAVELLDWAQVYDGDGIDPALAAGMFAAQAAGSYGVFASEEVAVGLFLLCPHVFYPLHTHAASEVYCCVAGEIDISHRLDSAPIHLTAGQTSQTPSGRLHALQTHNQPVLLAYIWTGEILAPTWWWEKTSDHQWQRTAWRRKPGEPWKIASKETVTKEEFNRAMR